MQYTRSVLWLLLTGLLIGLAACVSPPDYPDEPVIVYEGISKDSIYQFTTGPQDSIVIQFSFTDGDGDISSSDSVDIFYVDSRFPNEPPTPLAFPLIPTEGTGNGISGDVFFTLINTNQICCVFNGRLCIDDPRYPVDTLSYSFYIQDRAGNVSNTIRTEQINILCGAQ
ncbi:hypothetical protein LEM8419_02786 [Neolewinella maritima]|uniref:Uncharacterized protein n=1 Tax=Neolewinella maritima TaxID=1383882 RepID=A0ABN8F4K8_9BACT|nr:hypothetical protein [Neolewinella maritima]CAH1001878.1 hypothetical protein LEM8419_02786 [Neolewinella maritima]